MNSRKPLRPGMDGLKQFVFEIVSALYLVIALVGFVLMVLTILSWMFGPLGIDVLFLHF